LYKKFVQLHTSCVKETTRPDLPRQLDVNQNLATLNEQMPAQEIFPRKRDMGQIFTIDIEEKQGGKTQ